MGRAFARIVNVKELLQQIGDMSMIPILSVRQTVDINISSTCIKPCNGNVEHVG